MTLDQPDSTESEVGPAGEATATARGRARRWLWRTAVVIAALIVAATVFSFGYNAATPNRAARASTASGKSSRSIWRTKWITSPPTPHPKQW